MGIPDYLTCSWEICMQVKKQQKWTWNKGLVPNWEKSTTGLYIVTLCCLLLLPSIFPIRGFFLMSLPFASGDQSSKASASGSVLPMDIQGLFPLGLMGLISLLSKGLSRIFSSTTRGKYSGLQSSVTQLCSTLWDPIDCSPPGSCRAAWNTLAIVMVHLNNKHAIRKKIIQPKIYSFPFCFHRIHSLLGLVLSLSWNLSEAVG